MSTFDKNWRTIPTTHGLAMFGLLAVYFLIMRFVGLGHVYWLRALNLLFVYFVLRSALRTYRLRSEASYYEDFSDYFPDSGTNGFSRHRNFRSVPGYLPGSTGYRLYAGNINRRKY